MSPARLLLLGMLLILSLIGFDRVSAGGLPRQAAGPGWTGAAQLDARLQLAERAWRVRPVAVGRLRG